MDLDEERMDDEQIGEEQYEEFALFLRQAVSEALRVEDGAAFFAWMNEAAPRLLPELFEKLPDEEARKGFATEFGRSLWNSMPLPDNGFRPRPVARPERNEPCPCGSGKKYKKCCSEWADGAPPLDAEGIWMLVAEELPQEQVEALGASGRMPRTVLGGVATALLDDGDAARALALVRPLFERPERLDERDSASLNTLLEAYEALGLEEERWEEAERLARDLRPPLRAVLWENLARAYAVEGEMEEAWTALDRAREDDPESPALGPLEVSLLLAEGRTVEAGERARHWRGRLKEGDLSEQGFEFLAQVGENAEETQLRFSFGDEVTVLVHQLETWLAKAEPPAPLYSLAAVPGDDGAGQLVPAASLRALEEGFEALFYPPGASSEPDLAEEEDEDWDPWDEDRAERWLGFVVAHPEALDSVDILEDVAHAVSELAADRYAFLDRPLLRPILDRGLAIVRQALAAHPGIARLPSELEPNGSALALIVAATAQAHRLGETDAARELLGWLRTIEPRSLEEGGQEEQEGE
ncbi:MAG TPA: SEC-C metal-binding domain-containing protein [Thermoanaerobaculia bacterium]|nr:SEC-C metal-binding domain-containing protein [Thermoanaerobaculia bacterium]